MLVAVSTFVLQFVIPADEAVASGVVRNDAHHGANMLPTAAYNATSMWTPSDTCDCGGNCGGQCDKNSCSDPDYPVKKEVGGRCCAFWRSGCMHCCKRPPPPPTPRPPPVPPPPPPPPTYDCDSLGDGGCIVVPGGKGQFNTQAECESNPVCKRPPPPAAADLVLTQEGLNNYPTMFASLISSLETRLAKKIPSELCANWPQNSAACKDNGNDKCTCSTAKDAGKDTIKYLAAVFSGTNIRGHLSESRFLKIDPTKVKIKIGGPTTITSSDFPGANGSTVTRTYVGTLELSVPISIKIGMPVEAHAFDTNLIFQCCSGGRFPHWPCCKCGCEQTFPNCIDCHPQCNMDCNAVCDASKPTDDLVVGVMNTPMKVMFGIKYNKKLGQLSADTLPIYTLPGNRHKYPVYFPNLDSLHPTDFTCSIGCVQTLYHTLTSNDKLFFLLKVLEDIFTPSCEADKHIKPNFNPICIFQDVKYLVAFIRDVIKIDQLLNDAMNDYLLAGGSKAAPTTAPIGGCGSAHYFISEPPIFSTSFGGYVEARARVDLFTNVQGKQVKFQPTEQIPLPPRSVIEFGLAPAFKPSTTNRMLSGLRLSSSLINGVAWSLGQAGVFWASNVTKVLDASMRYDLEWTQKQHPPSMKTIGIDKLRFQWTNGSVRYECINSGNTMLDMEWSVIHGNGLFTTCLNNETCGDASLQGSSCAGNAQPVPPRHSTTCAYPQVTSFDMDNVRLTLREPQFPLPADFVERLAKSAFNQSRPSFNSILQTNSLCLPASVGQYMHPQPDVHMFPQAANCNSAGEGETLHVTCPAGGKVTGIIFASYGQVLGKCPQLFSGKCGHEISPNVSEVCIGQKSCTVQCAEHKNRDRTGCMLVGSKTVSLTFADPCRDGKTTKSVGILAVCSSDSDAGSGYLEFVSAAANTADASEAPRVQSRQPEMMCNFHPTAEDFATSPSTQLTPTLAARVGLTHVGTASRPKFGLEIVCPGRCSNRSSCTESRFQQKQCEFGQMRWCDGNMYHISTFKSSATMWPKCEDKPGSSHYYCSRWCNNRWGCGIATDDNYTCDCAGCNGCPPTMDSKNRSTCTGQPVSTQTYDALTCHSLNTSDGMRVSLTIHCPENGGSGSDSVFLNHIFVLVFALTVSSCTAVVLLYRVRNHPKCTDITIQIEQLCQSSSRCVRRFATRATAAITRTATFAASCLLHHRTKAVVWVTMLGAAFVIFVYYSQTFLHKTNERTNFGIYVTTAIFIAVAAVLIGLAILSGCLKCRKSLQKLEFVNSVSLFLSAIAFALHAHVWSNNDPFGQFDHNMLRELGVAGPSVDARHVQNSFRLWSIYGQKLQLVNTWILFCAALVGLMDGIPRQRKLLVACSAAAAVVVARTALMLVPSFYINFAILYDSSGDSGVGPSNSQAAAGLSLMFDGIAMTFLSAMYAFMLHGFAPGVYLGTCVYLLRVGYTFMAQQSMIVQKHATSHYQIQGTLEGLPTVNWAQALDLEHRRHNIYVDRLLSAVLSLNSLSLLLAPLGSCLAVIIVYQSIGAQTWWLVMWPASWIFSGLMIWALCAAVVHRWFSLILLLVPVYTAVFSAATSKILSDLVELARIGVCKPPSPPCGVGDFTLQFPVTEVISVALVLCSLTLSFLEYAANPEETRHEPTQASLRSQSDKLPLRRDSENGSRLEPSPVASPLAEPLISGSQIRQRGIQTKDSQVSDNIEGWVQSSSKIRQCVDFLLERMERTNTDRFGRRLLCRRLMLSVGLCLNLWVLSGFFHDNDGFHTGFVLKSVKSSLEALDSGNLVWPANGTKFDNTFAVYGRFLKIQFCMMVITSATLLCSLWCDITCRNRDGLIASRIYGYVALALMFLASLVPAVPNYINISHLDTVCPYCTAKFNFAVESALQDMVGIGCAAVFATKLLPVLLIVMPSLVRACSLILLDEASINKEYTSAMGSIQNTLAICALVTPLVTAIPTIVVFQILRRYGEQTFMACMLTIFYFIPIIFGFARPKRLGSIELRLLSYTFFYFIPLIISGWYEGHRFDFMDSIYAQLKDPVTYTELFCEVCLANVILSDIIYSCVYIHESGDEIQRIGRETYLCRVVGVPACFLVIVMCIVVAVWWP